MVEAVALAKSYGPRRVLDDVTFSVNEGEVAGLLGPNGAGKTTTLSILATLRAPDCGSVRIAGFDSRVNPGAIRRKLGFVPQAIALYPSLTPFENLDLFARIQGLGGRQARDACRQALEDVGLAERANDAVSVLSGGMQRRLNLACAMVHHPTVLLLDEPTVGVDPQSREKILQTIRGLAATGVAAVYSTHYMEEVERLCDRVLLIDQGRLVASGTVAELIALAGQHHRMDITFQRTPPPSWCEGIAEVSKPTVAAAGNRVTLHFASLAQVSELLERARLAGGHVLEFSVHSANLSDAFMALTGHALRDPDAGPLSVAS